MPDYLARFIEECVKRRSQRCPAFNQVMHHLSPVLWQPGVTCDILNVAPPL
jgi:hypothetical protein